MGAGPRSATHERRVCLRLSSRVIETGNSRVATTHGNEEDLDTSHQWTEILGRNGSFGRELPSRYWAYLARRETNPKATLSSASVQ
jgi:hypothetical protein